MAHWLNKLKSHRLWPVISALAIILLAGLLIEGLSLLQYNYTRQMLEDELTLHVESELTLKSVRVKGILKSNERMLKNHLWLIERYINKPDSIYSIIEHVTRTNNEITSCFVTYVPGATSVGDRLFEPCVYRRGDSIFVAQISGPTHDYTQKEFYRLAINDKSSEWCDPYIDVDAFGGAVTTYTLPVNDPATGKTVGAFGVDVSTQCIIDTINLRHDLESSFFLLLTDDGRLISHPDSTHAKWHDVERVVKMVNDSTSERRPSSSGKTQIIKFKDSMDNSTGYIYYASIKGNPHWQVVMVCFDQEVYGKFYRMRRYILLMFLAGATLLGFILYRFYRNMRRLYQNNMYRERTGSELRVAQNIQSNMLPSHGISLPEADISGKQVTALEVGGDLYDYFVRDEKLFFCIGDVSGKGVPSSLVMAVVHSLFRSVVVHESNPSRIVQAINQSACIGNETNMFVTLFVGVLDLPTGRLRYCNAGHDAPLLIDHGVKPLPVKSNLPVGVFEDFKYQQQQAQLSSDCTLFLYTDGLTEASNPEQGLYGLQRVVETVQQCLEHNIITPEQVMSAMQDAVDRYVGQTCQSDDLTMLALHYHQPQETIVLHDSIDLINDIARVPELNAFVQSVANQLHLEPSMTSQLMLAVEEVVVNVMNYSYPVGSVGNISVVARATDKDLKFIISDQGKAFDPTLALETDTTLSAEDRSIGGLGILLVRKLMDSINYERFDGKNMLTLKKIYNKQ